MPEETVAFSGSSKAIEAPSGPCWTCRPAVLNGGTHKHRMAFGDDAFGSTIAPTDKEPLGRKEENILNF